MRIVQSFVVRAIVAVVVGALLVKFREETAHWLTISIGALFFVSGLVSCFTSKPLPLVGIGSMLLGVILALMPTTFITGLMYALAAMIILGAINQFICLFRARRVCSIGWFYWLMPALILAVAVFIVLQPMDAFTAPLFVIGWCMMVYGLIELINGIKTYKAMRTIREQEEAKALEEQQAEQQAEEPQLLEMKDEG
ncbi:MAG: DUF308 domain-containing protein [Prevotella sp.]|nr:DUF308 domain-containing protein [Prevotella sp.]